MEIENKMRKDLKNNISNRLGERRLMNDGEECEIIEYKNARDVMVKFLKTGELVKNTYNNFKKGEIKSHFTQTIYNVGIIGLEETVDNSGEQAKSYKTWNSMLQRCYDKKFHLKKPTYADCLVCEEWKYYKNFKEWFNKNYYEIEGQKMMLDKDILRKNNKVYSPDTCVFVPERINTLFTKRQNDRGDLPIGVVWKKKNKKYEARCNVFDVKDIKYKRKYLGLYNTSEEAFNAYKKAKEENIKLIAEYYKDKIPQKLYDAMCRYEVSIND